MTGLSIPAEGEPPEVERFHWAVRAAPLFVSAVLAWLWLSGKPASAPDVRVSAPVVARPGSTIGIRAWQLEEDQRGRVTVLAPPVDVELRDRDGDTVARTSLAPSHVQGREGRLEIPDGLGGRYLLVANSEVDRRDVEVARELYVQGGIDSTRNAGRTVNAFQVYALEPLERLDSSRAPTVLDPRIEEGACAPELRCTLSVWVGGWRGLVRLRPLTGARADARPVSADGDFARFPVTVFGSEARVAVEAVDADGVVLARRNVRLPVVPGGMTARAEVRGDEVVLEWSSLEAEAPVLVDVLDGRRWVDALSVTPDHPVIDGFPVGVWRLQIRRDLFSANTGAVAFAVVPGRASAVAMAGELALSSGNDDGLDPLALVAVRSPFRGDRKAAERALLAVPSFDVVELAAATSARFGVDETASEGQDARRKLAAALILVVGLFVSVVLFRVEVHARRHAERVLASLASDEAVVPPQSRAGRGLWAFVMLVFVVVAVLALSKGWF